MEDEDRRERAQGVPRQRRSRQVAPTTGRFLFALVAPQPGASVLEIGGSRGYSTIWLAAGARILGGQVTSIEVDPAKCQAWRENIAAAGLEEWAELVCGDALEVLPTLEDVYDLVFLDAEKSRERWWSPITFSPTLSSEPTRRPARPTPPSSA